MKWLAILVGLVLAAGSIAQADDTVQALYEIDGRWQQGAVLRGHTRPGSRIQFMGKTVPVGPGGEFVLGLARMAPERVTLRVETPQGQVSETTYNVAKRDYDIQRIEGVPQKTVTPSKEQLERARKEAVDVWRARQRRIDATDFMASFIWPLTGPITGVYGSQRVYNGEPRRPHYGVDIARPAGTTVVAPAPGEVTFAEPDLFYSGGTLIVDHGQGLSSTFIHLSRLLVKEGDRVARGEAIGEVGASGRATGPHLDWRMNWQGERVDPTTLVGPMPVQQ